MVGTTGLIYLSVIEHYSKDAMYSDKIIFFCESQLFHYIIVDFLPVGNSF